MYAAKCLTILIVLAGLGVMWILYRKKTNQIMLAIAATILLGGVLRLFQLKDNSETVTTVGLILAALAVIWGASWFSNRSAIRRTRSSGAGSASRAPGRSGGKSP